MGVESDAFDRGGGSVVAFYSAECHSVGSGIGHFFLRQFEVSSACFEENEMIDLRQSQLVSNNQSDNTQIVLRTLMMTMNKLKHDKILINNNDNAVHKITQPPLHTPSSFSPPSSSTHLIRSGTGSPSPLTYKHADLEHQC